jgi:hypothetical protein
MSSYTSIRLAYACSVVILIYYASCVSDVINLCIGSNVTGGAWYGFGETQKLIFDTSTVITNNSAACCHASGYGSTLLNIASTLTCADTDASESGNDCCDSN